MAVMYKTEEKCKSSSAALMSPASNSFPTTVLAKRAAMASALRNVVSASAITG